MKKNIVIISVSIVSISLMAFNCVNWESSNKNKKTSIQNENKGFADKVYSGFSYNVGSRFEPITKTDLKNKMSVSDFDSNVKNMGISTYKSVKIIVIKDGRQTNNQEYGIAEQFTEAQLKLLQLAELSTHYTVRADFEVLIEETGNLKDSFIGPYFTVVPERQAVYEPGKKEFIEYLKIKNKENTLNLDEKKLRPAAIRFTITREGKVRNILLDRTSGVDKIDENIMEQLTKMPGIWLPAENSKGEKVDQEIVVSFGIAGC